jgi:hypothetical protein
MLVVAEDAGGRIGALDARGVKAGMAAKAAAGLILW